MEDKLTSIAYLIPYFGKLPASFSMWLLSCRMNPTVTWILITDDKTVYDYPNNVKVYYCSYDSIKERIQNHFDFPIVIDKPWRLCEYRPAYGEIFADELKGYDFWGHCDMDLIWGDIRKFITEDILNRYDKIGFQGHSTLYRNTAEVNARYRFEKEGLLGYKEAFQSKSGRCFDEEPQSRIYEALGLEYYHETNFAHLSPYSNGFYLSFLPLEDNYKNNRQVILWQKGKLYRQYVCNNVVYQEEYMYFHTFMRPIAYRIDAYHEDYTYVAYPDVIRRIDPASVNAKFIKKHGKCPALLYYLRIAYRYRKKLTLHKVWKHFNGKLRVSSKRGYR